MNQSTYDPCLLYRNNDVHFGVVGLQTDDTLLLANEAFADREDSELRKAQLTAKEREQLTAKNPLKFNGGIVQLTPNGITLMQERQCKNLSMVNISRPAISTSSQGVICTALTLKD